MSEPKNIGHIGVDFVDVLFAIVMGISATDVLGQPWFKQEPGFRWQASFGFEIGVLLLGYVTLIASWVGYHQSVGTRPQEIRTKPQLATFFIDIILLACYLFILVKFDNFRFVLFMLFLVFGLYVVWDLFRQQQRKDSGEQAQDEETLRRMAVSRFWFIFFALLLAAYWGLDSYDITLLVADRVPRLGSDATLMAGRWVFLSLAFAGIVLYRIHKAKTKKWLTPILDILTFQWPLRKANA